MSRTRALAVSAVLSALGVVLLYLGSLIGVLDMATLLLVSVIIIFTVVELGAPWHFLTYAVISVLAVLLLPNKFLALEFAMFGGLVPILKLYFERLPRPFPILLKIVVYNGLGALMFFLFFRLLGMTAELSFLGITFSPTAFYFTLGIAWNIILLCFDLFITQATRVYHLRFQERIRRLLRRK